ncbi:MAG: NAD(P)/FAD-dependent oxidoreductase [Thermoplasmata archaeon]
MILGAGYAGVRLAHQVWKRSKGSIPTMLVDRHPFHVIRTELYEVARLAARGSDLRRWTVPIDRVVGPDRVVYREGSVGSIDIEGSTVRVDEQRISYRSLAICLGNVPAYYGVAGADEFMHQVYGLLGAMRLADELTAVETASPVLPRGIRPRVVVVGGGSTGTEVAADIATADWQAITGVKARPPQVTLVCGALPFLDGLDTDIVVHARRLLEEAGVLVDVGRNVRRVQRRRATLSNGSSIPFDVGVWAAGVEAPSVVKSLPVEHGRAGRIVAGPTLEIPSHPGVFALGDIAQVRDPTDGSIVPATAQAALAEASAAAENILRRWTGRELLPFRYRDRGAIVAVGHRKAAARWNRVAVWGSPAAFLKSILERRYRLSSELGRESTGY